jgi:hypothetical protein
MSKRECELYCYIYIVSHSEVYEGTEILIVTTDLDKAIEAAHAHMAGDEEWEDIIDDGNWVEDDLSNEPEQVIGEPCVVKIWRDGEYIDVIIEKWEVEVSEEILKSLKV